MNWPTKLTPVASWQLALPDHENSRQCDILLARQIEPDWVSIDERLARRVAFAMGLPVKGTLGILLAAVLAGLLSRQEALDDLPRLLARGIRIAPRWQQWFRAELGGESPEDRA